MKTYFIALLLILTSTQLYSQNNVANYKTGSPHGQYIHGVSKDGSPAKAGDASYRELAPTVKSGVYSWWNYATAIGQPTGSYGVGLGFGHGSAGSAEIWAGWTSGRLYTRYLRDCCQGWSNWSQIWTEKSDGANSGLDADLVDGLQPVLIQSSGNVGIGTNSPGAFKLAVNGTIGAKEIKVQASGWADKVFDPNYKLERLEDVEKYISNNKHLPDVPSEKEVLEEGISLGEMDATLLQKVEELTLYLIQQHKVNLQLQQKISDLENDVQQLSNKN